jgi:hypothetical protein
MREYTDCYIAFLDVLGFKKLILNQESTCEKIAEIFDELSKIDFLTIEEKGKGKRPFVPKEAIDFRIMSDSVVISINANVENALIYLIITCINFQMKMLNMEQIVLIRGGITRGDVYKQGSVIFGPGLVNAYLLEEQAKYPRIIAPKDIIDNYSFTSYDEKWKLFLNGLLINYNKENDYSLDYITPYLTYYHKEGYDNRLKKYILEQLNDNDENIRGKYFYLQVMIERFNQLKERSI